MPSRGFMLPALLGLLLTAPAAAQGAAGLHVDRGSIGGRCDDRRAAEDVSATTPWCSLPRAAAAAPAGATVQVRRGTYPKLVLDDRRYGAPVTFEGHGRERPALAGMVLQRVGNLRFEALRLTAGAFLTEVSDLAFTDVEVGLVARGAATGSGFVLTGARRVLWDRVRVRDAWNGIQFRWGGATDITIRDSSFTALGNTGVHLQLASRVRIEHNAFVRVRARRDMASAAHADGVHLIGPGDDVQIGGNVFRGGRGVLIQVDPAAVAKADAANTRTVLENNVFAGPDFAIRAFSSPGLRIVHNTVWGTQRGPGTGIDLRGGDGANPGTTGVVLQNNIAARVAAEPGVSFAVRDHNMVMDGVGDVAGPPRFAGLAFGDLRLAPDSPGIGAGVAGAMPGTDRNGDLRRARPSLGAYR